MAYESSRNEGYNNVKLLNETIAIKSNGSYNFEWLLSKGCNPSCVFWHGKVWEAPVRGRRKYLPVGLTAASMPPTPLTGASQT